MVSINAQFSSQDGHWFGGVSVSNVYPHFEHLNQVMILSPFLALHVAFVNVFLCTIYKIVGTVPLTKYF